MRSIAEQDQDELCGRWSVLVVQKQDHQELDRQMQKLAATETARQPEVLQSINELVSELEAMAPEDPRRQPLIGAVVELLREDVRDEEDTLLPRLQEALE